MERARATWTDERLDDLSNRMDQGFARVDADIRTLRNDLTARIDAQGASLTARIDVQGASLTARMDARFDALIGRIDALQRTMLQVGIGTIGSILVATIGVVVTQA